MIHNPGARAFWAVLATSPLFIGLVRWRAAVEARQFGLGNRADLFMACDDAAERALNSSQWNPPNGKVDRSVWELGDLVGDFPAVLLLAAATLGGWLIWDLIQNGATLLAETMLDAEVFPNRPDILPNVLRRDWRTEAFGFTAIHFLGLALVLGLAGFVLDLISWL
jgi:hypothetical protein